MIDLQSEAESAFYAYASTQPELLERPTDWFAWRRVAAALAGVAQEEKDDAITAATEALEDQLGGCLYASAHPGLENLTEEAEEYARSCGLEVTDALLDMLIGLVERVADRAKELAFDQAQAEVDKVFAKALGRKPAAKAPEPPVAAKKTKAKKTTKKGK